MADIDTKDRNFIVAPSMVVDKITNGIN